MNTSGSPEEAVPVEPKRPSAEEVLEEMQIVAQTLGAQRNEAQDMVATMNAKLTVFGRKIKALEEELASLKKSAEDKPAPLPKKP